LILSGEEEMEKLTHIMLPMLISVAFIGVLFIDHSNGTSIEEKKAIIIVSSCYGENCCEIDKAMSFMDYLIDEGYDEEVIDLISAGDSDRIDSLDLLSNINSSFSGLISGSNEDTEVVIYISDNGHAENGIPSLRFRDGNITGRQFDSWFDQIICSELTFIIGGNRSGIIGPDVSDISRTVMSSMSETQVSSRDLFNITRSLEDPSADSNNDGVVSFLEAFRKEELLLTGTGQDPVLFE
jgi:hypothetical protein